MHYVQPVALITLQQISCFKQKEIWCSVFFFTPFQMEKLFQEQWLLQLLFGFCYFNSRSFEFTSVLNFYECRRKGTRGKKSMSLKNGAFLIHFKQFEWVAWKIWKIFLLSSRSKINYIAGWQVGRKYVLEKGPELIAILFFSTRGQ